MNTPHPASRRPGVAGDRPGAGAAPEASAVESGARTSAPDPARTDSTDSTRTESASPARTPRRQRPARPMFGSTVLWSEVFVVFFALLVAFSLRVADPTILGVLGAVGMVACAVAARLQRTRAGIVLGSAVQVLLLLGGFLVPTMFVVGGVFSIIWALGVWLGLKIDRERAERERAEHESSVSDSNAGTEGNG